MNRNIKTAIIVGGIAIFILIASSLIVGAMTGWGWRGSLGMMGGYGMGWLMPISMLVFWGLIIWAIIALIRGLSQGDGGKQSDSALEVLKKRYARGEINKQEYEEKRKDLE